MKKLASDCPAAGNTVMVVFADAEVLDVAGPLDLLRGAAVRAGVPGHLPPPMLLSSTGGALTTWPSGIELMTRPLSALGRQAIDTLVVPGGTGVRAACDDRHLVRWLARTAPRARRVVGICTGAFLLGAAGLLAGRRATTHWRFVDEFRARHPTVDVEPDAIFVADGNVYTSAGITAGLDLALHLIERDHGADVALAMARDWLVFARRPGGQSQFSTLLPERGGDSPAIAELCAWIVNNPAAPATVEDLARRIAMSPRHFARVFRAETGLTPARFVENARVENARRRLEQGTRSLDRVASACGLRDAEHLRRTFVRRLGVTPRDYRLRFEHGNAGPSSG